jgi:FxsC-like protein
MPDYAFFLSYASGDREVAKPEAIPPAKSDFIHRFFDDLNREVRKLHFSEGGFIDRKLDAGPWRIEIINGLACGRVLVPLYSQGYFRSEFCGKEWEVFNLRSTENGGPNRFLDVTPKIILPVLWRPVEIPGSVAEHQYEEKDDPELYKTEGLEYLMRFKKSAYDQWVYNFAKKVDKHASEQGAAKVRNVPQFNSFVGPFPETPVKGLGYVRYLFVAGVRADMQTLRQKFDCYGEYVDRRDWLPCFPELKTEVQNIVTRAAKDENKTFEIIPAQPREAAIRKLRHAKELNNTVVVVVDPWSLKISDLHNLVNEFDAEEFPNSAVIISWNPNDQETNNNLPILKNKMQDYFRSRIGRKEYHRPEVTSEKELETATREAFNAVRQRVEQSGKLAKADPLSTEVQPVITNRATGLV